MNTNERPTPETDVYIKAAWGSGFAAKELEEPMRRLERERDEARDRIAELEKQLAELQNPKEPETFQAHGLTWIKHTPGNFIPCSGDTVVRVLLREELYFEDYVIADRRAACWNWGRRANKGYEIIGWNYADAP